MPRMSLRVESEEHLKRQKNATGIVFIKTGEEKMISFEFHRAKNGKLYVTDATKPFEVVTELKWLSKQIPKEVNE